MSLLLMVFPSSSLLSTKPNLYLVFSPLVVKAFTELFLVTLDICC